MPLVSMRQLLDHAAENGYGLPAFNVNNLEQVQAIMAAADKVNAPVIMQASAGARKYAGEAFLRHLIEAAVESYPHIPVVMHQDHGQSPAVCMAAIRSGFTSVMMDGSLEADGKTVAHQDHGQSPAVCKAAIGLGFTGDDGRLARGRRQDDRIYDYNVDVTRKVVEVAHSIGVTVEGELGCLGSLETMKGDKEDGHGTEGTMTREQLLTDPEQAADFVKLTAARRAGDRHRHHARRVQVHAQAHGRHPAIDRIKEIHQRIPNTHLVMHGSSSVPQELLAEIREFGGDMKETYGVPVEEIQEGIKHGVRKINIDTDIRLAMTGAIRRYMATNPDKFDPRDYLKPAREAAMKICIERYMQFGCEGQAGKIKPVSLDKIAEKYKSGDLAQVVR